MGVATEKGRKVEFLVTVFSGHTEMKWAAGKVISKLVFLKIRAFIPETVGVHVTPVFDDIEKKVLQIPCVIFDCSIVQGISSFKISVMKKLLGGKDDLGESEELDVILLHLIASKQDLTIGVRPLEFLFGFCIPLWFITGFPRWHQCLRTHLPMQET